ncbi:hypothetical protein [Mycobacterium tuberculosis]|nr:hypothetical protein [Mycobacterium tuberculosis]
MTGNRLCHGAGPPRCVTGVAAFIGASSGAVSVAFVTTTTTRRDEAMRVLVTKPDGTQVEVHLDQGFRFLGTETVDND